MNKSVEWSRGVTFAPGRLLVFVSICPKYVSNLLKTFCLHKWQGLGVCLSRFRNRVCILILSGLQELAFRSERRLTAGRDLSGRSRSPCALGKVVVAPSTIAGSHK